MQRVRMQMPDAAAVPLLLLPLIRSSEQMLMRRMRMPVSWFRLILPEPVSGVPVRFEDEIEPSCVRLH
jgi:hypothetical protein